MMEEIERVLDQYVRPLLASHGGDLEVLSFEEGILRFRMKGHCAGCAAADLTTEPLIREELLERVPEVKDVLLVQEIAPELMDQARAILRMRHGQ